MSVPAAVKGVDEIRILEWHLEIGSAFDVGELIVELETHKAVVEIRANQAGVLRLRFAEAGDWRGIGIPLAILSDTADELIEVDNRSELAVAFEVS